ncbi:hypothetical protein SASPL_101933 [Salvia splendens]|uniref:IBR domain-containing protein n=1 Tax=Salvia splendens TaxID=180675 RepID=A0A8X8YVF4_SALSN|nr:hypothetical protein SASPL_101933 [Salvia splendens]
MIYEIWQDTSGEIWQDTSVMSDEIQQTFTCEICIEPSMLSQKFSHGANCVHNICFMMIPSSLFVKWSDCLCLSTVSTYTSCYCPYRDCSELIINECDMPTTKCACPACKRLVCYACRAPWHAGFRCSEASQVKDENDVQFGILLEEMKWKRCPKCGHAIERIQDVGQTFAMYVVQEIVNISIRISYLQLYL